MNDNLSSWLFPQTEHAHRAWFEQQLELEPETVQTLLTSRVAVRQCDALVRDYCGHPELPNRPLAKAYCALSDEQRRRTVDAIWHCLFFSLKYRLIDGALLRKIHQQTKNSSNLFAGSMATPSQPLDDFPIELHNEFLAHCWQNSLTDWLRSLGARALELIIEGSCEFTSRRLSITFEPHIWKNRPVNFAFNDNQLNYISEVSLTQLDIVR